MPTAVLQIFIDLQNWKTLKTKSKIWDNVALLKKLVWHCHSLVYQGNCEKLRQSQSSRALDCIGQSTIPERQANKNSSSCIFGVTYWVFPEATSMHCNVYESVSKSQKLQIYINAHGVLCSWKFGPKQSLVRHSDETQTHKGQKLEPNILGRKRWVSVRLSCLLERKSWKKIVS